MTMVIWCSASGSRVQKSQLFSALQIGFRIALDHVVQVREFQRIAEEEHRCVIADDIPVTLLGVELDREAADIALGVGAPRSPATVEKRRNTSVFLPTSENSAARVYLLMSWVTVKVP
jgi:hypothetical protein